ncbi:MAG: hypothetical protein ACKOLA_11685, partial [Spartobacteria bacterium]
GVDFFDLWRLREFPSQRVLAQLRPKVVIPMGSVGGWSHGEVRGVQGTTVKFSRQMLPAQPVTLVFNK